MQSKLQADVGIIIAKDHESGNFVKALKQVGISVEPTPSGRPDVILQKFEICSGDTRLQCISTYMNDQGPLIKDFTNNFLQVVDIKYLLTVGICGGLQPMKVMFFDEAWIMEETPPKLAKPTVARYGDSELWRTLGHQFNIAKPEDGHVILTVPNLDGDVGTTLTAFNEVGLAELQKTNPSASKASAVDMEIGYIFDSLSRLNYLAQYGGKQPINTLHAIKAVSDAGDAVERAKNKPAAMELAAQVAVMYLGFLLDNKLIVPRPVSSAPSNSNVAVPTSNYKSVAQSNNNEGYLTSQLAFTIGKSVVADWTTVSRMCDWENVAQLSQYMGHGHEVAALIILLNKKDGPAGLKKFREKLVLLKENSALQIIDSSPCKEMFY